MKGAASPIVGTAAPDVAPGPRVQPVLLVSDLRAYYQMHYFGITRDIRAVDDVSLHVLPNEIYGLAGESSCGKTTLIKTIAGAIQPPLNVVGGSVTFNFRGQSIDVYESAPEERDAIRWRHLSYIMQAR
jgi:peptide/nickel transport system ATP-binding protein